MRVITKILIPLFLTCTTYLPTYLDIPTPYLSHLNNNNKYNSHFLRSMGTWLLGCLHSDLRRWLLSTHRALARFCQ